jgi:hypothetical protein
LLKVSAATMEVWMRRLATVMLAMVTVACVGEIKGDLAGGEDRDPDAATPPPSGQADAREGIADANEGTPDADPNAPDADPGAPDAGLDDFLTCREAGPAPSPASGMHNAGAACMSCHGAGGGAPRWYAAGTLFQANRINGRAGVNVTVKDANGKIVNMVSANNGNFWTPEPLVYPLYVFASLCPDINSMGQEVPDGANCNGCHNGNIRGRITLEN